MGEDIISLLVDDTIKDDGDKYILEISDEDRYYCKNHYFHNGLYNGKELPKGHNVAISNAIEFKSGDVIALVIPKTLKDEFKHDYPEKKLNDLVAMISNSNNLVNKYGTVNVDSDTKAATFSFFTADERYSKYLKDENLLTYNYDNINNVDVLVYTRTITNNIIDGGYKYIYLYSYLPDKGSNVPKEVLDTVGSYIIKKGQPPYSNWNDIQNGMGFKHLLYQVHKRKKGK